MQPLGPINYTGSYKSSKSIIVVIGACVISNRKNLVTTLLSLQQSTYATAQISNFVVGRDAPPELHTSSPFYFLKSLAGEVSHSKIS
jgi:hypothetical protein